MDIKWLLRTFSIASSFIVLCSSITIIGQLLGTIYKCDYVASHNYISVSVTFTNIILHLYLQLDMQFLISTGFLLPRHTVIFVPSE